MTGLVVGNVVRWISGKGEGLGVVESVMDGRLTIRFDDGSRQTFAWPNSVLERVVYQPGKYVRRLGDGATGMVTAHMVQERVVVYNVTQPDGATRMVIESGLRPAHLSDPAALIVSGEYHDPRSTSLRIAAVRLQYAQQYEQLSALSNSRVEIKPHQVSVLHRVATSYPHRFILADEVGLGKTIEAGLIIKELKARGVADRVLVLAPSGIVSQWQYELKSKFNEAFARYNSTTVNYLQQNHPDENVWALNNNVVASTSYAAWSEERRREIALAGWDLVVIDEAHHVRRTWQGPNKHTETQLYKLAEMLADPAQGHSMGLLLLSATPMQLHPFELYSLIDLLDPTLFPDFDEFDAHREALAGLNRALDRALEWTRLIERERQEVAADVAGWLGGDPGAIAKQFGQADGREQITEALRDKHRISQVMIRNRKAIVGGFMGRSPHVINVRMTPAEAEAYWAVSSYAQHGYNHSKATGNNAYGFLMAIFQKLNASSSYALRQSLLRRIERLEEDRPAASDELPDDEEQSETRLGEGADWMALQADVERMEELLELRRLVGLLEAIEVDSKAQALMVRLSEIAALDADAKVIVFTQFRDTQEYLARLLLGKWQASLFHGQLSPDEKDLAVERFREGRGAQILISTEAGGEGRNFQFCHYLVNYDLPWNPMRVEQRIGRLDRIGQKQTVKVFNFAIEGTIEERILDVLSRRIKLFEETIGSLDPILGDAIEADIREVLLAAQEEADRAVRQLDLKLEDRVREAVRVEARLADMIMDTRSYRRDEVEQLLNTRPKTGTEEMSRFVIAALRQANVECTQDPASDCIWHLGFHGRATVDFERFGQEGRRWRVTFDPKVALEQEELEFLAFGHPLVDELVARVQSASYGGRTSRRVLASNEHRPQTGWFFLYSLEFEGVVPLKQLLPVYVSSDGDPDDEIAQWIYQRSIMLKRDGTSDGEVPLDGFDDAVNVSNVIAIGHLLTRKGELTETNRDRLEQERSKLERYYIYKDKAARDKLESVERILARVTASDDPDERRILPVWQKNLENALARIEALEHERDRRLSELVGRDEVNASHLLVSASHVEVVSRGDTPPDLTGQLTDPSDASSSTRLK